MQHSCLALVSFVLVLLASSASAQLMLPASYLNAYDAQWNDIINAGPSKVPIALINPNSGPGVGPQDSYVLAFKSLARRLQNAGIKVYGYVDTSYGAVPVATALRNIESYYSWIGVDGIFFDQTPWDCGLLWYYQQVYNAVKNHGGKVLLNPGAPSSECYMSVSDIILSAEVAWSTYQNNYQTPSWVWKYAATRFYHVAYNVPSSAVGTALQIARNRNAGYIFFTDLGLPNPYGKLPGYWWAQINALVLPSAPTPTPTPAPPPPTTRAPTTQPPPPPPTTRAPTTAPPTTQPPPSTRPPTPPPTTLLPPPPTTRPPSTTQPPSPPTTVPASSATTLPSTESPVTDAPTVAPMTESPIVTDAPTAAPTDAPTSPPDSVATGAPIISDFLLGSVASPVSTATADAPSPLPNGNSLVWRSFSLSASASGTDLLFGLSSYVSFSFNRKIEIYVLADGATTPSVTLKGNKMYAGSSPLPIATLNNPASGLDIALNLPLSVFPSRPNSLRAYALNTDTKQRIPTDGSFVNLALPVFTAHARFSATAPSSIPADAFVDTGAAASSETPVAGFSYGWSEDNTASSSSCIAFNGRNWTLNLPVAAFYRVRARVSPPAPSTCVGVVMQPMNVTVGSACDGSGSEPVVFERTVLAAGNSITFAQAANTDTMTFDSTQLCELLVTIATGPVLQQEFDVATGAQVDQTAVTNAIAALSGEPASRFAIVAFDFKPSAVRQDTAGRVRVTYLVADQWLTSSSTPASDVSSNLLAASPSQWAAVSPYTPVSSELVSQSGPVPAAYAPAQPPSSSSSSSSSQKAIVIGVIIAVVVLTLILVVLAIYVFHPTPLWRRDDWTIKIFPVGSSSTADVRAPSFGDVSSPITSTTALAPSVGSPAVEIRPASNSLVIRM